MADYDLRKMVPGLRKTNPSQGFGPFPRNGSIWLIGDENYFQYEPNGKALVPVNSERKILENPEDLITYLVSEKENKLTGILIPTSCDFNHGMKIDQVVTLGNLTCSFYQFDQKITQNTYSQFENKLEKRFA